MAMTMTGNKILIGRRPGAALAATVLCAVVASLAWVLKYELALGGLYVLKCLIGALVVIGLLSRVHARFAPGGELVAASLVTLVRALLVVFLFALVGEPVDALMMWAAFLMAGIASLSDAVDGWLARRMDTTSAFGARFDMETDAALIAALAVLAWYWERAGAWVLLAGAARYVFVLGMYCFRSMRRELPPSLRRKVVCVVQVVALLLCLLPVLTPVAAALCAALGVSALLGSFLLDTLWLIRAAHSKEVRHVEWHR
jgi:phosphatidylglycerophosphate synthase